MKFFSFSKNIISMDLGSYETKIVLGKETKDGLEISKAFSFLTPEASYHNGYIKDLSKLLDKTREELANHSIISGNCHLSIKSSAMITREILFPNLKEEELEGLLKYQLNEYLPMDPDKYIAQHRIIGKAMDMEGERLNVLVAAIPRDIVDMHYVFIKELGLRPTIMDCQSNCIWKIMNVIDYINDEITPSNRTIAIIDLGHGSVNITIVEDGVMKTNRVIEIDAHCRDGVNDTSPGSIIDRVHKIFRYYLSMDARNEIDFIVLYGGLSSIEGIDRDFSNYFNVPAIVLDELGRVYIGDDVNKYLNSIAGILRDDGM